MDITNEAVAIPVLLTIDEAANRLRISTRTLHAIASRGEISVTRVSRKVFYTDEAIARYIRRQTGSRADSSSKR